MMIIPAVDIRDGKVVRLLKGRFEETTVYSDDPVAAAQKWEASGAPMLHVVDLDGALTGAGKNFETIIKIAGSIKIPIQAGGGIRSHYDISKLIAGGVSRVILGTKAIEGRRFLTEVLKEWKEKIVVSLDCSNGVLAAHGWRDVSSIDVIDFVKDVEPLGLSCVIYTDITRDGTLTGPNIEGITALLNAVKIPVIASGGISSIEDIKSLLPLEPKGLTGVITGKAIYEGRLDLKEAISLCSVKE